MVRLSPQQLALIQGRDAPSRNRVVAGARARENGKAWEKQVHHWAGLGGWLWWAPYAVEVHGAWMEPGYGTRGALDVELVHATRGFYVRAELKAGAARLGPNQVRWVEAMRAAGGPLVCVWRDKHSSDVRDWLLGPRLSGRVVDPIPGIYTT